MLVPKLRFKREDGTNYFEWEEKRLGDISKRITRKNKDNITDIPLTIASLYGLIDQREYFKKTVASQNMENYYLLKNGEFAYNKSYSKGYDFGAIKRLDRYDCGALSTLYICFKLNDSISSDYMTHYFDSQKWNKEVSIRCAEGARNHGLLNIATEDFFDISMFFATDIEEQQKIADFFSTIDEVIAQSEAEVQNFQQQKKATMQKIFSQDVRFKREDGTEYPEWKEDSVFNILGKVASGKTKPDINGLFPLYGSMGIIGKCLTANYKGKKLLIARVGANAGTINYVEEECGVTDNTLVICSEIENLKFYYYALQEYNLGKMVTGSGQPLITGSGVQNVVIFFPCLEEQQKIADFLSAYDEAISYAKQELDKWKELKKGLLQRMFV